MHKGLEPMLRLRLIPDMAARGQGRVMMTASIAKLSPQFSMHRAVIEYVERYYLPAARASR